MATKGLGSHSYTAQLSKCRLEVFQEFTRSEQRTKENNIDDPQYPWRMP